MRRVERTVAVALSLSIAGCSIHPLPEDVTGVKTTEIVKRIRCEARDALRGVVTEWIVKLATAYGDPFLLQLASDYTNNPSSTSLFKPEIFRDDATFRSAANLFYDAGIAYSFDLTGTEINNIDTDLLWWKKFTTFVRTLDAVNDFDRTRSNRRTFTTTDTFSGLLKLDDKYCEGHIVYANYVYPIVGRIGIDRTIRAFIDLTIFENLGGAKAGAPPTLTDDLTFTTTVKSIVNPLVVFTPVTNATQLTKASLTTDNERTDRHEVTVGLAIGKSGLKELDPLRNYLFSPNRVAQLGGRPAAATNGLYIGGRVTGGGTLAEQLAVIAIDQYKTQQIQVIPRP